MGIRVVPACVRHGYRCADPLRVFEQLLYRSGQRGFGHPEHAQYWRQDAHANRIGYILGGISLVGFIVMLWTYFGVNLLLPGLHAYA